MVDHNKMRTAGDFVRLVFVRFLQCFDTVGSVKGRASSLLKKPVSIILTDSLPNLDELGKRTLVK